MEFEFSEEEELFRQQVRRLAKEKIAPLAAEIEESKSVISEIVKLLGENGIYNVWVPKEYGGIGVKLVQICIAREELSKVSTQGDYAFTYGGLGPYCICFAGTEKQKRKYLPGIVEGKWIGAFALTEPNAGSDVVGIQTTAKLENQHYVINGEKIFTTLADVAGFWIVFAKTDLSRGRKGISCFIVEPQTAGIEISKFAVISGLPEIAIKFSDCKIAKENLVGNEGDGWDIALGATLNITRVSVGAAALGMAETAFEEAFGYAQKRLAFGQPIVNFQAIQFKLADMATQIEAARWLVYRAAYLRDKYPSRRTAKEVSLAKLFATEAAWQVCDEAV